MALKKTESGKLVYEFDKRPVELVPLSDEECVRRLGSSYYSIYDVKVEDGTIPYFLEFQGSRHPTYGVAFGSLAGSKYPVATFNIGVVATLCKMMLQAEGKIPFRQDEEKYKEEFDPWDTGSLSRRNITFPIPSKEESERFMAENALPREGFVKL